jgi:hypothetical protein
VPPPVEPDWEASSLCDEYSAKDVALPLPGGPVVLRQLVDLNHPRIHGQYWCLYDRGVRSDCWFFSPTPTRADDKLLSALWLEDAATGATGELLLRVRGTMVRPMGGWWTRGAELTFAVDGARLRYLHALVAFTVIQPYDRIEPTGEIDEHGDAAYEVFVDPPMVAYEAIAGSPSAIVRRVVDEATEAHLAFCGVDDLRETSGSFEDWRQLAACITAQGDAVVSERPLDEPTFIERSGVPSD